MVLAVLACLGAGAALAQPAEYRITTGGDNLIKLEVEKTGLFKGKKHIFHFSRMEGKLVYDAQAPASSKVDLTIDARAFEIRDDWVDEKDKEKVFREAYDKMLQANQHPQMRFVSTKVTPQGANRYLVEGALTIRGVSKPVTIDALLDPDKLVISGKSVFRMTSYGMKPPSAALGAIGTKDEMTATFKVTAVK
ncbi:MAG: YceI family protein [Bryobacteraceae bacterium]|nr:YceI family protein [Bryobacteraceae bacterium]MDW8377643.1 YceI family protein [Bryobacterales bacterium]